MKKTKGLFAALFTGAVCLAGAILTIAYFVRKISGKLPVPEAEKPIVEEETAPQETVQEAVEDLERGEKAGPEGV